MLLNLSDPASIMAWWKVMPERHGLQLEAFERLRPQFGPAIRMARLWIKSDPALRAVFEQGQAAATARLNALELTSALSADSLLAA